jgi:hypothetical protein
MAIPSLRFAQSHKALSERNRLLRLGSFAWFVAGSAAAIALIAH